MGAERLLAIIPARGGSKGLPGKNIRPFAGLPLLAHSILFAKLCPQVSRLIVSTDSPQIADVARQFEAEVPFTRPLNLAQDDTPLWHVLQHTLKTIETQQKLHYDLLLLLDPTSPARLPEDLQGALSLLERAPDADGVICVSRPPFHPIWHSVVEKNGWMADLFPEAAGYQQRQELPPVYHINGSLYLWRTRFVRSQPNWRHSGRHLIYEIPELRAISIDTLEDFDRAQTLVKAGVILLPWLVSSCTVRTCDQ